MSDHNAMHGAARLIVERAIRELMELGANHQAAARILAIQGFIRIEKKQAQDDLINTLTGLMDG